MKKVRILFTFMALIIGLGIGADVQAQSTKTPDQRKADKFASITIAVVNSYREFHIAFVRYYDSDGNLLLNTSEEFRIDISKSQKLNTGSITKSIPLYNDAEKIVVSASYCTNMHENDVPIAELEANDNKATFVFRGEFEKPVRVKFIGVQSDKPATFNIAGENTNVIFYADYDNVLKTLPEEATLESLSVEPDRTSLYEYSIDNIEKKIDEETHQKTLEVTVSYVGPGSDAGAGSGEEEEGDDKKKKKKRNK